MLPALTKALKMACLSYKPSTVLFDQKMYDRTKLVEAQGYLLFLALKQLTHLDFDGVEKQLLGASFETALASDSKLDMLLTDRANDANLFEAERHSKHTAADPLASEESIFANSTETPVARRGADVRRSNEATRLASLVPQVHNVRGGKLVPNAQRLVCERCEADLAAKSVDTSANIAYTRRTKDYDRTATNSRQPSISKKVTPSRRISRLANSVEFGDSMKNGTTARSAFGSKLAVVPRIGGTGGDIYNFNTINVVGTPAHLQQALSPIFTPNSRDREHGQTHA